MIPAHSRFELLYGIVFRTVFVAVLLQSSWTPNVVLALVGVASAGTAFAYTSYIPFYRQGERQQCPVAVADHRYAAGLNSLSLGRLSCGW